MRILVKIEDMHYNNHGLTTFHIDKERLKLLRFDRQRILPVLIKRQMTATSLAQLANISRQTAMRAMEGLTVSTVVIGKVADALGIDAMEFLDGGKHMTTKKTVTIIRDDGTTKEVEILVDDSGKAVGYWGDDDDDAQKAFAKHLSDTAEK